MLRNQSTSTHMCMCFQQMGYAKKFKVDENGESTYNGVIDMIVHTDSAKEGRPL